MTLDLPTCTSAYLISGNDPSLFNNHSLDRWKKKIIQKHKQKQDGGFQKITSPEYCRGNMGSPG